MCAGRLLEVKQCWRGVLTTPLVVGGLTLILVASLEQNPLTFLCVGIFNKWIDKNLPCNPAVTGSCSESVLKQGYPF